MKGLTVSLGFGLAVIVLLMFAPEWVQLMVAATVTWFMVSLGLGLLLGRQLHKAARWYPTPDACREDARERADERRARDSIYGGSGGGWRS